MYELEPGVDAALGIFHARAVIEVDVHFHAVFVLEVVDHVADVLDADIADFAGADFHEYRRVLSLGCQGYGLQSGFVVEVERPKSPVFSRACPMRSRALAQLARTCCSVIGITSPVNNAYA